MYSDLELAQATSDTTHQRPWTAVIANTATTEDDLLFVVIPGISPDHRWGPCNWMSRPGEAYPQDGQKCVVAFDEKNVPTVLVWYPTDDTVRTRLSALESAVVQPVVFTAKRTTNSGGLTASTWTVVGIDEVFDSHGFYNGSRFQPTIAGWYHFTAQVLLSPVTAGNDTEIAIAKNGTVPTISTAEEGGDYDRADSSFAHRQADATIFLNGTTDYVEVYVWCQTAGAIVRGDTQPKTIFSGFGVGQARIQYATPQNLVPVVTSIAAGSGPIPNPIPDGFEVYYDAGVNATGYWHLKYMAGITNKWRWVGGGMLRATAVDATTSGTGSSYTPQLNDVGAGQAGCKMVLPFAGDYWVESSCAAYLPSGPVNLAAGIGRTALTGGTADTSPPIIGEDGATTGNGMGNLFGQGVLAGVAAGQTVAQFYLYTSQTVTYVKREFWARPALVS